MIRVGLAVVGLRQDRTDAATASLRRIAADPSPVNRDARTYAQFIIDERARAESVDRMNDLWQNQDFDGVIALANELLRSQQSPANRESLERTRDRAEAALDIKKAVGLAGSGRLSEARRLLLEADAKATDPQMKAQIQALLDRIANAGPGR